MSLCDPPWRQCNLFVFSPMGMSFPPVLSGLDVSEPCSNCSPCFFQTTDFQGHCQFAACPDGDLRPQDLGTKNSTRVKASSTVTTTVSCTSTSSSTTEGVVYCLQLTAPIIGTCLHPHTFTFISILTFSLLPDKDFSQTTRARGSGDTVRASAYVSNEGGQGAPACRG